MELQRFIYGDCLQFALAFQRQYGGAFLVMRDEAKACERTNDKSVSVPLLHVWVMLDNGKHYDARGEINPDDALAIYLESYKSRKLYREIELAVFVETRETLNNLFRVLSDDERVQAAKRYLFLNRHLFPVGRSRVLTQDEASKIWKQTAAAA